MTHEEEKVVLRIGNGTKWSLDEYKFKSLLALDLVGLWHFDEGEGTTLFAKFIGQLCQRSRTGLPVGFSPLELDAWRIGGA